ncbi:MAG: DNA adenine methylase [Candidatus Methanomethylophilaceae archaeon]|nr:DNA adenine methylase [Candidatus Methanomethylophilaceae archaeon]
MTKARNPFVRPYLKWAGGKRQLEGEILPICPRKINTYYEPFVGAGAIFFALQPEKAVINDLNDQLCLTYMAIKDNVTELIEMLKEHKSNNSKDYYYELREKDRLPEFESYSVVEKAARLIYLNKTCYNGLYRVNSMGHFNTPHGRYQNPAIFDEEVLLAISKYLNSADITIRNMSFEQSVKDAEKGDFVYFDPPYDSPNCTNFTGYQAGGFDHEKQTLLKDVMDDLTDRGVKCLMSNAATDFIIDTFKNNTRNKFKIEIVRANRMIGSHLDSRGKVDEVLIRNYRL